MNKLEFSLLWPQDRNIGFTELPNDTVKDLNIEGIVDLISKNKKIKQSFMGYLTRLPQSVDAVIHRQNSFDDLMMNSKLRETLLYHRKYLDSLHYYHGRARKEGSEIYELIYRINELNNFVALIDSLYNLFNNKEVVISSNGFKALRKYVENYREKDEFKNLKGKLPNMVKELSSIGSISIGINLDSAMEPTQVVLEKCNSFRFQNRDDSFISKLFDGIEAPLYSLKGEEGIMDQIEKFSPGIKKSLSPVIRRIKEFRSANTAGFVNLKEELDFLFIAIELFNKLKSLGVSICKPEIVDSSSSCYWLEDSTNLNLNLLRERATVGNLVDLNNSDRFGIINGPNSGGKTVYLQGVGLNQILAQVGLYVLGEECKISLVDNIFTHYQVDEKPGDSEGRFGVEAKKLKDILEKASSRSLLLFNESLSSTSVQEATYIAGEILKIVSHIGARGFYTTHMKLDESEDGIFHLSAEIDTNGKRTYKVLKGNSTDSYGRDLAMKIGITYESIINC